MKSFQSFSAKLRTDESSPIGAEKAVFDKNGGARSEDNENQTCRKHTQISQG